MAMGMEWLCGVALLSMSERKKEGGTSGSALGIRCTPVPILRILLRLLVAGFLLAPALFMTAKAAVYPAAIQARFNVGPSAPWFSTVREACEWYADDYKGGTEGDVIYAQGGPGSYFGLCKIGSLADPHGPGNVYEVEIKSLYCPANSTFDSSNHLCVCKRGFREEEVPPSGAPRFCVPISEPSPSAGSPSCRAAGASTPNPILPASTEKYRSETDWQDAGPTALSFVRTFRSRWANGGSGSALGQAWSHNHDVTLVAMGAFNPDTNEYAYPTSSIVTNNSWLSNKPGFVPVTALVKLPEGFTRRFTRTGPSAPWIAADSADTLSQVGNDWMWRRADDDRIFSFDGSGKLQTVVERGGRAMVYSYNGDGRLAAVSNAYGRALSFIYAGDKLASVTTPGGQVFGYVYDSQGRLSSVLYPDGKSRSFLYENSAFPEYLTGIVDETGARWATFTYNSLGQAIISELADGVSRYQVSYPSGDQAEITDPLGTVRNYLYMVKRNRLAIQSTVSIRASGDPTEVDASYRAQDANGLITAERDMVGTDTTTTWDTARRLPLTVVRASGRPEAQTTTTQWHPTFTLPVLVTEPGRTTAYTHDAFGNVLSKTVTDTATNKAQTWQWTYNAQQLAETATEPNGAVTTYTYDPRGNLLTSTNALGHVTSYTYDLANRVVSSTEPNGLVTTYAYDPRDRLLTQTVGGLTTTLTYKPYGKVETVSLPTGLVLTYTYDPAHRLTGWSNNRGESGSFTLDGMGNRTAEQIKDSAGNVAWSVVRTINNINRLASQTEGANQTHTFGYDANGERIRTTNGLNHSTQFGLDPLRRVQSITDPVNLTATLKYNALDAVTEAKDFKGAVTGYTRDAQGNATTETSADIGSASTQYDALGLPSQITDALGQATTITRDPLGRPTSLVFADGKTTTLRYDLTANSKGYLSEIIDRSGTTEYTRDGFGRVTLKKQTLANGSVQQVSYSYNPNGTLASIGYPNGGGVLTHSYDATGRLTGLSLNGTPLVTGIAWNPLGQPTAWTWAFASPSLAASRSYDTAGRMTATEFSSYVYDAAGRISSLTQNLYKPGDTDPTHSTLASADVTWTTVYSAPGRLRQFDAPGNTVSFTYDNNGNRATSVRVLAGKNTSRTYTVGSNSNRLTGFTQTINGASSTSVSYGYNANGDLLTDGLRSYGYDAEGRLATATTGATDTSPTTRYAHNALGQRVFKTEPLYPPSQGDETDPGFWSSLVAFFSKLWSPATTEAEQLGYAYVYDEQGSLIAEIGSGGANSAGQSQYLYLPTANGPMPIAAVINGNTYAVHSDHLNTPRRLSNAESQAVWQWSYSAFGEDKPTVAKNRFADLEVTPNPGTTNVSEVKFNLRYPGQYFDSESGLHYNWMRSYDPRTGRYTQTDPIGLDGGWNPFGYAELNPLLFTDPFGLASDGHHWVIGPIRRDPSLSSPAREVFERSKTGPIPGGHNFGEGHSGYNKGVKELWEKHLLDNKIDPSKMTAKQAEEFVSKVKGCDDPRVRNFNLRIYNKFIKDGFRRMPVVRSPE